ncbi:hypothetical protein RF55_15539 [Lasius niger]|uniref:Uncharacterized protein n=1 Tax=Lasius niger TaxID=67767 RepID=A0A0J7K5U1_LASNI|nr:hypothetical protein RF55_15539 [Lasius niger]
MVATKKKDRRNVRHKDRRSREKRRKGELDGGVGKGSERDKKRTEDDKTEGERKVRVRGVEERIGEGGREILLVIMEKEEDKEELLERSGEIKRRWEIIVDEDLTREERKIRWKIEEKARMERRRERKVVNDNRRIWIEGIKWKWDEEKGRWREWVREGDNRKGKKGREKEGKGRRENPRGGEKTKRGRRRKKEEEEGNEMEERGKESGGRGGRERSKEKERGKRK